MAELHSNNTHIARSEFTKIHQELQRVQTALTEFKIWKEDFDQIKSDVEYFLVTIAASSIRVGLDEYITTLENLISAIILAHRGISHRSLIYPEQVLNVTSNIKRLINFPLLNNGKIIPEFI